MDIDTGARCVPVFILFIHNIGSLLGHAFIFFKDPNYFKIFSFYSITSIITLSDFSVFWLLAGINTCSILPDSPVLRIVDKVIYFLVLIVLTYNIFRFKFLLPLIIRDYKLGQTFYLRNSVCKYLNFKHNCLLE